MRTILSIAMLLLLMSVSAQAQFEKGQWEMGIGGALGSITGKTEVTYGGSTSSSEESKTYAYVSWLPAYYIIDGLSIELELGLLAVEKQKPGQLIVPNLSYTYKLPDMGIAIFGRAGYGLSNSFSVPGYDEMSRASDKLDIGILNLGAGAKFLFSKQAYIRTEINYRSETYSQDSEGYTTDHTLSGVGLVFGLGMLF